MSALAQKCEPQMQENPITVSGGKTTTATATAMMPQQEQQSQHEQPQKQLPSFQTLQQQQIHSEALPKHLPMYTMPLSAKLYTVVAVGGGGGVNYAKVRIPYSYACKNNYNHTHTHIKICVCVILFRCDISR